MTIDKDLVIAVDGPAGAGKSTIARIIADELNYIYIDTGAMYRALTLKALKQEINLKTKDRLTTLAKNTNIRLIKEEDKDKVLLDGIDVTKDIRDNRVSNHVSLVAKVAGVRQEMVRLQREMARKGGIVMDGRDIGTVVLPEADLKVFLTASVEERAKRRYQELENKEEISLGQIKEEISKRDSIDKNREVSPLKKAKDAVKLDTTDLNIEEVTQRILELCQEV